MQKLKPILINQTSNRKNKNNQIIKLIQIDKKYALMNVDSKYKVSKLLQDSLDYLLGKKERQNLKKDKLRQMQQSFETKRNKSITKIFQKISRSDKVRNQSLNQKQMRLKRDLQFIETKIKKKMKQNQEQIEKMLQTRKHYLKNNSQSRISKVSSSSKSLNKSIHHNKHNNSINALDIDEQISFIQQKINHAKTNQRFYHQQKSQKAKAYSKDVGQTMSKIHSRLQSQQNLCFSQYYKTSTKILKGQERSRNFYLSQSEKKKRIIQQKFKKCGQKLKHLQTQREQKYDKLQVAFNRMIKPKTWTNQKNKVYLQFFSRNKAKIQNQKRQKASEILKKHFDNSLKNKALKQQKQKIRYSVKTNDKLLD